MMWEEPRTSDTRGISQGFIKREIKKDRQRDKYSQRNDKWTAQDGTE